MSFAGELHDRIASVAPIKSVCVGRVDDKDTWRIIFQDEATSDQRAAAIDALLAFEPSADAAPVDPNAAIKTLISALIDKGILKPYDLPELMA
jgi:hypothetical protein